MQACLEINPSTGVVSLKSQVNFESGKTSYAFTVTATDADGDGSATASSAKAVTISLC